MKSDSLELACQIEGSPGGHMDHMCVVMRATHDN